MRSPCYQYLLSPCHEFGYYVVTLSWIWLSCGHLVIDTSNMWSPCCTPGGSRRRCRPWCRGYTRAPPPWPPATGWPEPPARRRGCRQSSRCWPLHLCFRWGHRKHYLTALQLIHIPFLIDLKVLWKAFIQCNIWMRQLENLSNSVSG